jgi:tellurite resistance-related uncharacterized protein
LKTIPPGFEIYRRTREFSESTNPAGLRMRHTTKPGVWARIVVREGSLRYRILEPGIEEYVLSPGLPGVVEPEIPHEVEPVGRVCFCVEFFRPLV